MSTLKVPHGAWVVVCDGAKALVLENIGDPDYPDLRTREAEFQPDPPTHELGTGAPGRVHQSVGAERSAVEQTDFHDEAERAFLTDLARQLDRAVVGKKVAHLVVVAPPRALGMLRKEYSAHVKQAVQAEIDKDLVAMPIKDIEAHIFGHRTM